MGVKQIIEEIDADVLDIIKKEFKYINTTQVPSRYDTALTFERGVDKVGKEINTCILYVDIRNSVELTRKHHLITMGRIYSIFSKSMLKLAKYHSGSVRNIIGDRVMIVFPTKKCFTNSIECAISINNVSQMINKQFKDVDFKCGIGIDYGTLRVLKVGLHRQGTESIDNKNLVWTGYPANLASRLTDVANKTIDKFIRVKYYPYNYFSLFGDYNPFVSFIPREKNNGIYSDTPITKEITSEEFGGKIEYNDITGIKYSDGKLISFEKIDKKIDYPPILMTENVYNGLKKENSNHTILKNGQLLEVKNHQIKNISSKVYGSNSTWKIN